MSEDPRGTAAIEALDRIQRAALSEGRVTSDGTLVTESVIVSEVRAALSDFHATNAGHDMASAIDMWLGDAMGDKSFLYRLGYEYGVNPEGHEHFDGCGHAGEGVEVEFMDGWREGRRVNRGPR